MYRIKIVFLWGRTSSVVQHGEGIYIQEIKKVFYGEGKWEAFFQAGAGVISEIRMFFLLKFFKI